VAVQLPDARGRGCYDDRTNREGNQYCVTSGSGGSLESATTSSSNSAFTRLFMAVGPQNVADLAARLGVTSSVVTAPAGALGTTNVSPIEMASAFSVMPNNGVYEPYYFIDRIEDRNGRVVYEHQPSGQQVISKQSACLGSQVLLRNVQSGTGRNAQLPRQPAAGKTGTTDEGADTWFVGFTPYLTTAVWLGNPYENIDSRFIGGRENFGGEFPATLWGDFMRRYQEGREVRQFPGCGNVRGNGSVKGKGNNQYVFGFATAGSNNK
jgi:penicillin-binding protein 1A